MKDTSNIKSFFPVTKEESKIGRLLFNTMANQLIQTAARKG